MGKSKKISVRKRKNHDNIVKTQKKVNDTISMLQKLDIKSKS